MARLYTNENIEFQVVITLRELGHDVLTSLEAGNANRAVEDEEVLQFAATEQRILVTHNRLHFVRLHQRRTVRHAGIVVCSVDPDFAGLATRIHSALAQGMADHLARVNRT